MIYVIVHMKVEDQSKLDAYLDQANPALTKHGGILVAAAIQPTVIQAAIDAPDMAAVLGFPDKAAALAWRDDPELADLYALRDSAGPFNIFLVG